MKITTLIPLLALMFSGAANAIPIDNLAHLTATGETLAVDDKVFGNFGYQPGNLISFDPANILVTATQVGQTDYLTFTGNMAVAGSAGTTGDLILTYTVTALGTINSIDQFYVGGGSPPGTGNITVDELVIDSLTGNVVANSHLDIVDIGDPPAEFPGDDLIIKPGLSTLEVLKDIGLGIGNGGQVTFVSVVRQSFHQGVPDSGAAVAMLGIALVTLGLFNGNQRKQ